MKRKPLLQAVSVALGFILTTCSVQAMETEKDSKITTKLEEEALALKPNIDNGRQIYEMCAVCHSPHGWGTPDGRYPQIAGQHYNVIIKQLGDIRAGNRDNPTMYPFTLPNVLGGAQDLADVAAYIEQLPMSPFNDVGPGFDLSYGKELYKEHCEECHGKEGEGDNKEFYPRIQGQHFTYLLRQMRWIQIEKRRNADKTMVKQIHRFSGRDIHSVIDYTSRLRPPADKVAKPDWRNRDFPDSFVSVPRTFIDGPWWDSTWGPHPRWVPMQPIPMIE